MANGQRMAAIEAALDHLLSCIRQERANLLAKGTTPQVSDVKYQAFWSTLAGFSRRLELHLRDLRSAGHFLGMRSDLTKTMPRGTERYRARQSVAGSQARLQQVLVKAQQVEAELRKLYFEGQKPTVGDIVKSIDKLSKELQKVLSHDQIVAVKQQLQQSGPQFEAPQPGVIPVGSVPISFFISLIIIYIHGRGRK